MVKKTEDGKIIVQENVKMTLSAQIKVKEKKGDTDAKMQEEIKVVEKNASA